MSDDDFRPPSSLVRAYPEATVGGFTQRDGFIEFYTRVNSLLEPTSRVLDFGAGRGLWATEPLPAYSRHLRAFHERVDSVVGVDVDSAVLDNPHVVDAHVISPGDPLPFADDSFDLVLADYVLEHVTAADAPAVAAEILRVLKPGGWFAARTPNKWGVIGMGARAVPNRLHDKALERLQPDRKTQDIFPVEYAMNTRRHLKALFPEPHELVVYGHSSEPRYFGDSLAATRAAAFLDRLTPPRMASTLMVFVRAAG